MEASPSDALAWQTGIWNDLSDVYQREIDRRFEPVIENVIGRAAPTAGETLLDLGCGTGAAALAAATLVGSEGSVLGVDLSGDMLRIARRRADGMANVTFREGRAEQIPAEDSSFDVLVSSLCLMYAIDRAAAAAECARVLRPGGRFVAAVWAGPEICDIVRFQATAGSFAPAPPAEGVGPGALADARPLLSQLTEAGIDARVETEALAFDFPDFETAWDVLARVTTANLPGDRRDEAKAAVRAAMWPEPDEPRVFNNTTQFIVGRRR